MSILFPCNRCYEKTGERHWLGTKQFCRKCIQRIRKDDGLPIYKTSRDIGRIASRIK